MHVVYVQFWCLRFSGVSLSYYSEQQMVQEELDTCVQKKTESQVVPCSIYKN